MLKPKTMELRSVALLALLILGAVLGNYWKIPLFFGVDFLFGSIAVLLITCLYGTVPGILAAGVAGLYSVMLWGHPFAAIILVLEALWLGWLSRRLNFNLLLIDGAFWFLIGMPLVFAFYGSALEMDEVGTRLVMLKQAVNGIFNALIASLILNHTPLARWSARPFIRTISLRQILFNLFASLLLIPALLVLIVASRREVARIEVDIHERLRTSAHASSLAFKLWRDQHINAVGELARVAGQLGVHRSKALQEATERIARVFPQFSAVHVLNPQGISMASYPPMAMEGPPEQGLRFADRRYFTRLEETLQPFFSGVISRRGQAFDPLVTVAAPVVEDGMFLGYVVGALDLSTMRRLLDLFLGDGIQGAALMDQNGLVIASTRSEWRLTLPFQQLAGWEMKAMSPTSFHRAQASGLPAMTRWRTSFFAETIEVPGSHPWTLYLEVPVEPHQTYLLTRYIYGFLLVLALAFVALVLAFFLARRLVAPLTRLAEETTNLPDRLHEHQTIAWPSSNVTEVDSLVGNFQSMVQVLQQQFQEVQQAGRAKDVFLAMLAHELRNPLAPILAALRIMEVQGQESPPVQRARATVQRQVGHMVRLIDDLLDVSRITRGKIELRCVPLELVDAVRQAIEGARPLLEARHHRFSLTLPDRPVSILADPTRFEQILSNLLTNAAKYTEPGGQIDLTIRVQDAEVVIEVLDDGVGIAPDLLPRVFELFMQAERSLDRSQGGLGIGLTLVQRLVVMHGGTISAQSAGTGKGSRFIVRLPLMDVGSMPAPPLEAVEAGGMSAMGMEAGGMEAEAVSARGMEAGGMEAGGMEAEAVSATWGGRILLVEDNPDSAASLEELLTFLGYSVRTAGDGLEGLKQAANFRPQVMVVDIGLPGIDGYEVARCLRREPWGGNIYLVALTGYGQDEDRKRSAAAGFDRHMTKPVDLDALEALLMTRLTTLRDVAS